MDVLILHNSANLSHVGLDFGCRGADKTALISKTLLQKASLDKICRKTIIIQQFMLVVLAGDLYFANYWFVLSPMNRWRTVQLLRPPPCELTWPSGCSRCHGSEGAQAPYTDPRPLWERFPVYHLLSGQRRMPRTHPEILQLQRDPEGFRSRLAPSLWRMCGRPGAPWSRWIHQTRR